jgi:hypothetical protein
MQTSANNSSTTGKPWEEYDSPEDIVKSDDLSPARKGELIDRWIEEVEGRLDATNEGMPPYGQTDDDLNLLEKLRISLEKAGKTQ